MDVERTTEFILDSQAKQAAHMDAIDRRMDGVTKLIQQGTRLTMSFQKDTNHKIDALIDGQLRADARLEQSEKASLRVDAALEQLAKAQKATEQKLQRLIDRQGRNGH
jgi:cytoskeletal protein CcmA (bactofilin family)